MRISPIAFLGFLQAAIFGQDLFEPVDFNVTQALLDNGVKSSALPEGVGYATQSQLIGCSLAVSASMYPSTSRVAPHPIAVLRGHAVQFS